MLELKDIQAAVEGIQAKTLETINQYRSEATKQYEELKAAGADTQENKSQLEKLLKRFDNMEAEYTRRGNDAAVQIKSLGQIFADDDGVKSFAQNWHKGNASVKIPGGAFFPHDFLGGELKTTITSSAVGAATPGVMINDRLPGVVKPGVRRLRVRDLMTRIPIDGPGVEWLKENVFTNASSPTAETISKPESALTFTIDNIPIRTIAAWIPAAKQILDDFKLLSGYINTRLMEGLMDVEDYEVVAGDGSGNHVSGLSTEATAYDTARNVTGDTKIDTLNHAISQIEDVLQEADGIIIHPRDWRAIQLIKTNEGNVANNGAYLLNGPQGLTSPTLWGLPVATTTAVARGTFFVGAFKKYCLLFDRMTARIDVSTEHADYFVRNMVAIRAEERIGFAVTRNDAVVMGSFPS